jgi:hypothetical protein
LADIHYAQGDWGLAATEYEDAVKILLDYYGRENRYALHYAKMLKFSLERLDGTRSGDDE